MSTKKPQIEQPRATPQPSKQRKISGLIMTVALTLAIFIGGQLIGGLLVLLLTPAGSSVTSWVPHLADGSVIVRFLTILAVEIATIVLLWRLSRFRGLTLTSIGLTHPKWGDLGYGVLGFAVYVPAFLALVALIGLLIPGLDTNQTQALGFEDADRSFELILVFLSLVILPPIAEEIVFRGFVYTSLRLQYAFVTAAIWTSLLFATPHLLTGNSGEPLLWLAFIDTFVLSMILVYLRERTGRLWAPIVLHALKNGGAFVFLFILQIR